MHPQTTSALSLIFSVALLSACTAEGVGGGAVDSLPTLSPVAIAAVPNDQFIADHIRKNLPDSPSGDSD